MRTKIAAAIAIVLFSAQVAAAGTILLLGAGKGSPGGGPPPVCSNSLDFSDACNSQYLGMGVF